MMKTPAQVSVIIPAHNAAPYLRECVESALQEGVAEVILVENGSTDNTPELCRELEAQHPDTIHVYNMDKGDVSMARNLGTAMAREPFIMYLDADDRLLSGSVNVLLQIAARNKAIDCVIGQMTHRDLTECKEICGKVKTVAPEEAVRRILYQKPGWHPSASAKLYRRHVLDEKPFTPGRRYEDLQAFAAILARCKKVAFTKTIVYYYRPVADSFINKVSPSRFDALWAVDELRTFAAEQMPTAKRAAVARSFSAYFDVFMMAMQTKHKDQAKRSWQYLCKNRLGMLTDRNVRLKNKAGALLTYLGPKITASLAKLSDALKC